jgi:hypothetical protein
MAEVRGKSRKLHACLDERCHMTTDLDQLTAALSIYLHMQQASPTHLRSPLAHQARSTAAWSLSGTKMVGFPALRRCGAPSSETTTDRLARAMANMAYCGGLITASTPNIPKFEILNAPPKISDALIAPFAARAYT